MIKEFVMKKIYYVFIMVLMASCVAEEKLVGNYEYDGPVPPIEQGGTEAQNLCFEFYESYGLNVYYTLAGDDALRTELGETQTNPIIYNNPNALPMQLPDENAALSLLKTMKSLYEIMPEKVIESTMYKRQVLVKVNPAANRSYNTDNEKYYMNYYSEDMIGVLYYGDLDETISVNAEDRKYCVLQNIIYGIINKYYKRITVPEGFTEISAGYYKNEEGPDGQNTYLCFDYDPADGLSKYNILKGYEYGFVLPEGASCSTVEYNDKDLASYAIWAISTTAAEIEDVLGSYQRVKAKYQIAEEFFMENYGIDFTVLNKEYSKL